MGEPAYSTLALDSSGDLAIPVIFLAGRDAVTQRLNSRFLLFKSEWFLDKRKGVPYYEKVFVKNPNLRLLRSLFRDIILRTPGVRRVLKFTGTLDTVAREYSINFEAEMSDGSIFRSQPEEFIIKFPV